LKLSLHRTDYYIFKNIVFFANPRSGVKCRALRTQIGGDWARKKMYSKWKNRFSPHTYFFGRKGMFGFIPFAFVM